jgi:nitrate/nitrite transporter NarK
MNATLIGLGSGLALGFAAAFGGFGAFVVVLVLGTLGLLAGRWFDGKLDLSALLGSAKDRG